LCRDTRERIPAAASCSEEAELYRRHHRNLQLAVSRAVDAPRELIEDACQNAWTVLLRAKPTGASIFGWLLAVAIRDADRMCETERRCTHVDAALTASPGEAPGPDAFSIDDVLEAREALHILASLPDRQREDLTLVVAGFSYDEIAEMTGERTLSTVRKHVAKAHDHVRLVRVQGPDRDPGCPERVSRPPP
jgi:DNA-directed RNA polymerase specialized sigma24 family protein